jgi:hypothetical protein
MQIFQRQLTIIELTVGKYFINQVLNESLNSGRRRNVQGTGGGLNDIRQHDKPRDPRLGFGTRISEIVYFDGIFPLLLFRLVIKIGNQAGAVVLSDGVYNLFAQFVFRGDFNTMFDV